MASIVREAFASRIAGAAGQGGGQPNPADFIRALRGGRGGGSNEAKSEEAKMTITVDTRSNALIVTAPEPLFLEVQELVKMIDQGGAKLDEDGASRLPQEGQCRSRAESAGRHYGQNLFLQHVERESSNANNQRGGFPGGGMPFGGAATGDIQRRMQFMQRMQQGMGGQPFGGGQPGGFGGQGGRGGFQPGGGGRGGQGGFQPGGGGRGGQGGGRGGQGGGRRGG